MNDKEELTNVLEDFFRGEFQIFYILDENNEVQPCGIDEACEFLRNPRRFLFKDEIDNYLISTVFLPIKACGGCFETMIFNPSNDSLCMQRYYTFDEAKQGHQDTINNLDEIIKDYEDESNL